MQDHFRKVYEQEESNTVIRIKDYSKTESDRGSLKISGLYVKPQIIHQLSPGFRLILVNGELCKELWIIDVADQYFSDIMLRYRSFCYIFDITCDNISKQSEVEDVVIECCRKMVKDFIADWKDLLIPDFDDATANITDSCRTNSNMTEVINDKVDQNIGVIDLFDQPGEYNLENVNLMSKSDYKGKNIQCLILGKSHY